MSGSLTPAGNGLIEWLAVGGSADGPTTDTAGYALGAKTVMLASAGTGSFRAGKRIKFNGDNNYYTPKYSINDVSGAGLASSSTTDATGYAIGASTVTVAAAGTGSILQGNVVNFAGDATDYTVTSVGVSDVSAGGSITFTPALVAAIPASATAIACRNALTFSVGIQQEILAGVTKRIYSGGEFKRAGLANIAVQPAGVFSTPVADDTTLAWFNTGQVAQIHLDQGYTKLAVKQDNIINRSVATSGVSQTVTVRQGEMYDISLKFIDDLRAAGDVSDLEAIISIFEAFDTGVLLAWFPDFVARPAEFYYCTLEKRSDPIREGAMHWHGINFTLRVESGSSVSIPTFGA